MKLVNDDSDITGQLLSINTMNDKNEKHSYLLQIKGNHLYFFYFFSILLSLDPHTWQVFINNSLQTALALEKEKQDVLKKKEEAAHKLEEQHSKTELTQDAKPENEHVEGKLKKEKRSSGIKESIEDVDSKSTKREKKEKENLAEDSEGRITKRDRKDKPEKLDKESKSEKETTEKGDNEPVSARTPPSSSSSTPTPIVSAIPKVRPIDAITQSAPTKRHRSKSVNSSFVLTPTSSEVLDTSSTKDDAEVCLDSVLLFFFAFINFIRINQK